MAERTPTRSEYLALKEERQLMLEGHQFLDEKRISLAHELLRQLAEYEERRDSYAAIHAKAVSTTAAAAARHGLEGLWVYPLRRQRPREPRYSRRSYLGLGLLTFQGLPIEEIEKPEPATFPSPEAEACAQVFSELTVLAADLALQATNLYRLLGEYRRTERRARALENVLLPDIDRSIRYMEEQLEAIDQEEAMRVRFVDRRPGA